MINNYLYIILFIIIIIIVSLLPYINNTERFEIENKITSDQDELIKCKKKILDIEDAADKKQKQLSDLKELSDKKKILDDIAAATITAAATSAATIASAAAAADVAKIKMDNINNKVLISTLTKDNKILEAKLVAYKAETKAEAKAANN